jgi:hypothetical protein
MLSGNINRKLEAIEQASRNGVRVKDLSLIIAVLEVVNLFKSGKPCKLKNLSTVWRGAHACTHEV